MRAIIYISGISATLLLLLRIIGILTESPLNRLFLILGLILLLLVFLPLVIIDKYQQNKKINKIIESYRGKKKKTIQSKNGTSKTKGWGMNNSPFKERKSGLTWGGGNIHGANASRGTRRSLFNK